MDVISQTYESEPEDKILLLEYQDASKPPHPKFGCGGKSDSLEKLLLRYQKPLFNFIYRMTRDKSLSEDILQEVFLKVIKNIKKFAPERENSFRQWLYQIAINLCRDNFRHKQIFNPALAGLEPVSTTPAQNSRLEIEELIAGLPKEQKEVVLLKVYSGLTFREIAETLKCPLNTAISRMHYALKTLRKKVK